MADKRIAVISFTLTLVACGGDAGLPDEGPPPALTGPLLGFDSAAAAAENAAKLPAGFTTPQLTVCAADTSRGFLSELFEHGISNPQVAYEWAPIVPGPDAAHPTIRQPELLISGAVTALMRSGLDFRPAHPFGFDTTWDMTVDDPFLALVYNRAGDPTNVIHAEIERGLFPDATFGFTPAPGDRVLTVALAFANPYRTTQLYGPPALANQVADDTRYANSDVKPFTGELETAVFQAAEGLIDHFEQHVLVEATRFQPVTWFVCAPAPRPSASASLGYSYRFVARTGVTITAATRGDSGCLAFRAELDATYQPVVPARMDYLWTWTQINSEASAQIGFTIDVRKLLLDALTGLGFTDDIPALHEDAAITVDEYAPLAPRAGADADAPTAIVTAADDQPFAFYGRARVFWKP